MAKKAMDINDRYKELGIDSDDVVDYIKKRLEDFAYQQDPKIYYQQDLGLNRLAKITKIKPELSVIIGSDILMQVNPNYFDAFKTNDEVENINDILIDQELDKINYDKKGKLSISNKSLRASVGILHKFDFEDVARAEEIESLLDLEGEAENK